MERQLAPRTSGSCFGGLLAPPEGQPQFSDQLSLLIRTQGSQLLRPYILPPCFQGGAHAIFSWDCDWHFPRQLYALIGAGSSSLKEEGGCWAQKSRKYQNQKCHFSHHSSSTVFSSKSLLLTTITQRIITILTKGKERKRGGFQLWLRIRILRPHLPLTNQNLWGWGWDTRFCFWQRIENRGGVSSTGMSSWNHLRNLLKCRVWSCRFGVEPQTWPF